MAHASGVGSATGSEPTSGRPSSSVVPEGGGFVSAVVPRIRPVQPADAESSSATVTNQR